MGRLFRAAMTRGARLIGTALAVTLAVGLVSGTFMLTDTVGAAFHRASASSTSNSDIVVRSTAAFTAQANSLPERQPLPQSLLATVAAVRGIRALWPTVEGYALIIDKSGKAMALNGLPTVGSGWTPGDTLDSGRPPRPGEVAVDLATARRYHLHLGEQIKILFQGSAQNFAIAGVLRRTADLTAATSAVFDTDTAQRVLGQRGQITAITVKAEPGSSASAVRARINAILPSSDEAVTAAQVADEAAQSWAKSLGFLPVSLLLLAGVAVVVGALLIGNTFSMLVAQRTRELGLLRAIGASRDQLRRLVLAEALVVGFVASLAGIAVGFGAAHGLMALVRSAGLQLPPTPVVFRIRSAVAGLVCGVAVTAVAAYLPARRAAMVTPLAALNAQVTQGRRSVGRRVLPGSAALLAGAVLLAAGAAHGLPTLAAMAGGTVAVLVGLALLLPMVAGPAAYVIGAPLVVLFGQPASLARQNAMRSSRRTAATAAALMIGIGSVAVVSIVTSSIRASATATIQRTLRADLVVVAAGPPGSAGVPDTVVERLRHTPGVGLVSEVGAGQWGLAGATETLLAVDPATVTEMHQVDPVSMEAVRRLDSAGVLVRDTVAEHHGWAVGSMVPMTFALTGTKRLPIRGIFSTTAVRTDYVISLQAFQANYRQPLVLEVDVKLAPGIAAARGQANVRKELADLPAFKVMDRGQVMAAQQSQVDGLLTPVAALLGLSVLIGVLGIANALALSFHERTGEMGLLRAVGMARRQLRTMVRCEAAIVAGFGSLLGLAVGAGLGWASVTAIRHLGVTQLVFPVGQLAALAAAATGAALIAAILPARRAGNLQILDAVQHGQ
jgi:putative ABC transport system permease protein